MILKKKVIAGLLICWTLSLTADIQPAGIFTDGAVFQQQEPVRIWGTADPSEPVELLFAGQTRKTVADKNGKWMLSLSPMPANSTPQSLILRSDRHEYTISNVLVGEVWLAGGQSNMRMPMQFYRKTRQADIEASSDTHLRLCMIPRLEYEGQNHHKPHWQAAAPDSVAGFSATAYYFAEQLRETLKVPVGIICCSVGSTPAEAWMSRATLSNAPELKKILDAFDRNVAENYQDFDDYLKRAEERDVNLKEWYRKRKANETPLPAYPAEVMGTRNYKRPGGLYATMLSQTIPYTIRGTIWYQGENNAECGAGFHYRNVFPALINAWRSYFRNPEMPFLFVQLATFGPAEDHSPFWPELRESQQWTAAHVKHTGMVVLADGGEIDDIHPDSKDKAGYRLSLLARNLVYHENQLICRGPHSPAVTRTTDHIELIFDTGGCKLVYRPQAVSAFEICGENGVFVPAEAKCMNNRIIVSSDRVTDPRHVRYGWKKWFLPSLFNEAGLPASPFRTDDFKPVTLDRYYLDRL
jgi:sialate O-acetylesterase